MITSARKAKDEALFWWCALLSAMSQFAITLTDTPIAKAVFIIFGGLAALYTIIKGTSAFFSWVKKKRNELWPFDVAACDGVYNPDIPDGSVEFHKKRMSVLGVEGLFLERLTLRMNPKEETICERIKVEFLRKKRFRFNNVRLDEIRVDGLLDVGLMVDEGYRRHPAYPMFSSQESGNGGYNGDYRPSYHIPANGDIWLSVGYKINIGVGETREYYLSVSEISGNRKFKAARMKIIFTNKKADTTT